ncbi:hypothetical protein LDENG_00060940, partial [Lucifuga dentata]
MLVSAIKDGSGMLVRSVVQGGSVSQDGRLSVGDAILAINGEPTSNLTNAKARAMLRRHSVIGPEISITCVPANQVDEYRSRLGLQPLASITADSTSSSPTHLNRSPEPPSASARSPGPVRASAPTPATFTSKNSASFNLKATAPATVSTSASVLTPSNTVRVPTITPASESSSQTLKCLPHSKKTEIKEDGKSVEEKKDKSNTDGTVPEVEVEVKVDNCKEEPEEELHIHTTMSWDQPRSVRLTRAPGQSLGISIMGGRGMGRRLSSGEMMRGVFIKHISPDSPAAHNGTLQTGDRILEVCGVDLRGASHEQAVEAIRRAGDFVVFLVQSGQHRSQSPMLSNHERISPTPQPNSHISKEAEILSGLFLSLSPTNPFTPTPFKVPPPSADRMDLRNPITVTSPITMKTQDADDVSRKKMLQRYGSLPGKLHMIELEKDPQAPGLGVSLTGNKDGSRARMSVYVADIDPQGPAGVDGRIRVGDELLEINGQILYGRSHQNASTIINNAPSKVKIILVRNKASLDHMAQGLRRDGKDTVDSQTDSAEDGGLSRDIKHIILPQDSTGLGLCIAEDESREGVVVRSLIQHGTASKDGRIKVGDRIIAMGDEPVAGLSVDKVSSLILKQRVSGAVIIHEVNDGGAAQRDGRLQAGDEILEVNGIDFRQATHDEAIGVLRLTTQRVRLCVFRHQEAYKEEDLWDVFNLELRTRPGQELGLTTVGK